MSPFETFFCLASAQVFAALTCQVSSTTLSRVGVMFLIRFFFAAFVTLAVTVAASAQQKTPFDDSIVRESETFENTLQATWPTKGKDAKAWKAEGTKASAANDHRSATGSFASSALLDKKNARHLAKAGARISRHRNRQIQREVHLCAQCKLVRLYRLYALADVGGESRGAGRSGRKPRRARPVAAQLCASTR